MFVTEALRPHLGMSTTSHWGPGICLAKLWYICRSSLGTCLVNCLEVTCTHVHSETGQPFAQIVVRLSLGTSLAKHIVTHTQRRQRILNPYTACADFHIWGFSCDRSSDVSEWGGEPSDAIRWKKALNAEDGVAVPQELLDWVEVVYRRHCPAA